MISLWWLIGLLFIAFSAHFIYSDKSRWLKVLAAIGVALGFLLCFLLGVALNPWNHHSLIVWMPENPDLNFWIDLCFWLTIWGSAPVTFWLIRKRRQLHIKQPDSDAN